MRRLLIRPGAVGDCILALPELESLCGAGASACQPSPSRYVEVWAPRPILPLIPFYDPPFADRTRAIPDTGLDLIAIDDALRAAACLKALAEFDSIYSWYGANRPEFRDAVRHLPFTFFPALPINRIAEPRIRVPQKPIDDFAVIHPFSGSPTKNMPLDHYLEIARILNLPTQFCAGPNDTFEDRLRPVIRIENLFELACWLATARVYIGNDSGITHLAAAVGVPTVAIFLSTDSGVWAPRGAHVAVLESPTVEAVAEAARRMARAAQPR